MIPGKADGNMPMSSILPSAMVVLLLVLSLCAGMAGTYENTDMAQAQDEHEDTPNPVPSDLSILSISDFSDMILLAFLHGGP